MALVRTGDRQRSPTWGFRAYLAYRYRRVVDCRVTDELRARLLPVSDTLASAGLTKTTRTMGKSDDRGDARRVSKELTLGGFLVRLAATTVLVLATYNPTGWSFVHWLKQAFSTSSAGPEHFVVGVLVLIGWIILLTATQRSMGTLGLILGGALFGGVVWMLVDFGVLRIDSVSEFTWVILIILSLMLAIGLSWSHVWRRLTGQFDTDEDD